MKEKKSNKGIIIAVAIFAVLILVFLGVFLANKSSGTSGSKSISITVVNADGNEKSYSINTDQEYLKGVLDELVDNDKLTYSGLDQTAGFIIQEINGDRAVYEEDGKYWSIYVNGEYAQYGIKDQPVADGDKYKFQIESM